MAKKKLNVKFLALVLGALGVGVAILGLIVLVQFRNDPVRHVKRGDTLMEQGDYESAMQQYIRAIGKNPTEMDYYDLAVMAADEITPNSRDRTGELYQLRNSVLAKKIEYASPQGDLDTREVRDLAAAELLDSLDVYTFGLPRARNDRVVRSHENIASRVRDIDAALYGLGDEDVDPRVRSAIRGLVVAPLWRGAYNLDEGDWSDAVEEIEEAIALDPGYVPNQYGLLRGMIDRFESDVKIAPTATLRRLLDGDGGLNERIASARNQANGPSPELDLIEFERDQILLLQGRTGDDEDSLGTAADPGQLADVAQGMRSLIDGDLDQYELRARLVEMWWAMATAIGRRPSVVVDQEQMEAVVNSISEAMSMTGGLVSRIADDDEVDLRSGYLGIIFENTEDDGIPSAIRKINQTIEIAEAEKKLGPNQFIATQTINAGLQKRFDLALLETPLDERMDEKASTRFDEYFEAIQGTYSDDEIRDQDPRWHRMNLLYNTRLSVATDMVADVTDDVTLARDLRAESMEYATEAISSAREYERSGSLLDGLALEATIIVAAKTGEVGTAARLFRGALEADSGMAKQARLQARLADLLVRSGQIDDAQAIISKIRASGEDLSLETMERIQTVQNAIARSETGDGIEQLPGVDKLNDATAARIAGDLDELRRVLDELIESGGVDPRVMILALLDRSGLAETQGDYEEMRMYATRALEIDPNSIRAKILMSSNAETTGIDRMRTMVASQFEDPQDAAVQLARNISTLLGGSRTIAADEIADLEAELDQLQARIAAEEDPRPMAISYLFEKSVMAGDYEGAEGYIGRLEEFDGGESPRTIAMAADMAEIRGDLDGAIRIIENAVEDLGFGSDTMRLILGDYYSKRGDRADALAQYQEAFDQAPNRWLNALKYGQSLLAEGMVSDALQVLRAGRLVGRNNEEYRNVWLYVEIQSGNYNTAIEERQRLYGIDKFDRKNAIELARLLAEAPVGREGVVHKAEDAKPGAVAGEPRFDTVAWSRLSRPDRAALQLEVREERLRTAKSVFETLRKADPTSPEVVVGVNRFGINHPKLALDGDVVAEAEAELRRVIATEDGSRRIGAAGRLSRILAEKGRIAFEAGDFEIADACFEEAIQQESKVVDEAVTTIVSMLYAAGDMGRAAKYQAVLLDRMEENQMSMGIRRKIASQLAKMYVGNSQVEQASLVAEEYFNEDSVDSGELTVLGTIAFGEADIVRREEGRGLGGGLSTNVLEGLLRAESIYRKALQANARNLEALVQIAAVAEYRWLYSNEEEREASFAAAVKETRRAVENDKSYWPTRLRLVKLLAREDQRDLAITELRDHLDLMPDTEEARSLLLQLLEQEGRIDEAIDFAQASLERDSANTLWARSLGRLRGRNKEYSEAASLFGALYAQTGNVVYLRNQVTSLMAWKESDGRKPGSSQVLALVRENQRQFSGDVTLIGAYCTALMDSGRRSEGLRNYENAYKGLRDGPLQQRAVFSSWLSELFPSTKDGCADLASFVEKISEGRPQVFDLLEIASAWNELGPDGMDSAISATRRAVAVASDDIGTASALGQLGILLTRTDDCAGALDAFEKALAIRPSDLQLLNNIAFLMSKCGGDLDLALERSAFTVKQNPYRPEYRDTLGLIYLTRARQETDEEKKAMDYRRARQELELAGRLGTIANPMLLLARLEIDLGNFDQARRHIRSAGDRNPSVEAQAQIDELLEQVKGR